MSLLPAAALDGTFPCRLTLDAGLRVVHRGPALTVAPGDRVDAALRLVRPEQPLTFELLLACGGSEIVLEDATGLLGGVVVHDPEAGLIHILARRSDGRPLERERAATILLRELATVRETSLEDALRRVLRADAEAMTVERVSYWELQDRAAAIVCRQLYVRTGDDFSAGTVLHAGDFPGYFAALTAGTVVAAADAHIDPRTREFSSSYLRPLGIGAMLDVPVYVGGALAGVLCHEHVGGAREWTAFELQIAVSVAQSLAQIYEADARRRAEEAGRASEARFRRLVEISPVPILVTRVSDGKILYASLELATLLGVGRDEIMTKSSLDFYYDPGERVAIIGRLQREGFLREHELRLRRPDGSVFWSMLSAHPFDFDGERALLVGIVDLSEHKRVEDKVREVLNALADRDFLLTSDLERARLFQDGMLPPPLARPDVDLEVLFLPADEVSGDLYDVDVLDGRLLRLFVADATGHGVSAALTTMFLRSEYDVATAAGARNPAAILRALNARMMRFADRYAMRFTAVCLTLDLESGEIVWSSAAHPSACVLHAGGVRELETGGTFVGLVEGAEFPEWTSSISPGDTICLFSDGLSEALDRSGKPFGEARLHAVLAEAAAAGVSLARMAFDKVTEAAGELKDDAILLAARWSK